MTYQRFITATVVTLAAVLLLSYFPPSCHRASPGENGGAANFVDPPPSAKP